MAETILETFAVQILFKGDRRALDRWEQGFKKVNMQLNSVARTAAVAGGALTAALFGVGRTIVGFEQTMNNLQALLNASSAEMEELREQALEFGSATAFSASQVGEAQTELALVFGDVEKTLKALPDVLNLASAGQLSMGEAAKLVGNQMNAFGLTVNDVGHITDVLAKAASSGATTVRELGPAFAQVAAGANTAGLSIERTTAFIVALRDIGLRAEQAGTALRNIIVRLTTSRPPQDFLDALNSIEVSFEELKRLAQRGEYEEIFRRLGDAGLDAATAISIFGTEGFSAGGNLTDSISKVEELTESLIGAEGWAERMRLIQEQGLPGAVAAFRSALEGLQLSLGEAGLTGWIAKAADTLRGFVVWLRNADGWVKTTMAIVLASGPVLLGLAVFLKLVTFALSGLVPLLKIAAWANTKFGISAKFAAIANSNFIISLRLAAINVRTYVASQILATLWNSNFVVSLRLAAINVRGFVASLSLAKVAQLAGAAATGIASAATWAFNAALLANPLTWIVLAIVGLIAALVLLVKHWDTVKRVVRDFFDRYGNYVLAALAVAMPFIGIPLLIARNWSRIVGVVRGIWGTIVGIFRDHWAKILAVIFPAVGLPILIAQEWDQIVGFVGDIWSRVYDTVKGWIEAIISFIKEIPGKVKDAVKDIPNIVTEAVKDIPVVGQVLDVAGGVADKAKGLLGGIGKVFTGFAEGGIVPGPLGRPVPATVHGGEMILPPSARQVLLDMFEGFRLGPAALPQAPYHYGQMYRSSVTNRTVIINMNEPIVIQTQATDAKGIAQELGEAIEDQIRNVAYDHDGPVER